MKMIMAIVSNEDNAKVSRELTKSGFFITKLASTGGFLMSGNTTLMTVTEDKNVDTVIDIIKQYSQKRTRLVSSISSFSIDPGMSIPIEVNVGGATIFVLNVEKMEKL